jgi:hypothetical protein
MGIPLIWTLLPTAGNSDTATRTCLLDRLCEVFPDLSGTFSGTTSSGGSPSGGGKSSSSGGKPSSDDSASSGATGQDSFSREIKFIIISTGNITPTWKLIQVSANSGNAPFFSTGRTRTHDLLITIGPPTLRTVNDFLASQIGQAVRPGAAAVVTQ